MWYMLLELETLLAVPSHTKNKIGDLMELMEYIFLLRK